MKRYIIWYIDANGNKGRERLRKIGPDYRWTFPTEAEVMQRVNEMLNQRYWYAKVWVTMHNS